MSYSPTIGRWLETDPAGYVDSANLYEMEKSNPTTGLDPLGTETKVIYRQGGVYWELDEKALNEQREKFEKLRKDPRLSVRGKIKWKVTGPFAWFAQDYIQQEVDKCTPKHPWTPIPDDNETKVVIQKLRQQGELYGTITRFGIDYHIDVEWDVDVQIDVPVPDKK